MNNFHNNINNGVDFKALDNILKYLIIIGEQGEERGGGEWRWVSGKKIFTSITGSQKMKSEIDTYF